MKVAHFYAYGIFGESDPLFKIFTGEDDPNISAKRVVDFISANGDADTFVVHINSRGGSCSEGFAIHDLFVNSGKKIITIAEGLVASIATVVFLAGAERKMSENAQLMIHNPWIDPTLIAGLTADEIARIAADVKQEENRIVDFYVSKTGNTRDVIVLMMQDESTFGADKALELKFATVIMTPVKALSYIYTNSKKENKMTLLKDKLKNALKGLTDLIDGTEGNEVKNFDAKTSDGKTISVDDPDGDGVPAVGDKVTVDGQPAVSQTLTMEDGSTITTDENGAITEVKPKEDAAASDLVALRAEVARLKAEKTTSDAAMDTERQEVLTQVAALNKKVVELKAQITSKGEVKGSGEQFKGTKGKEAALSYEDKKKAMLERQKGTRQNKGQ